MAENAIVLRAGAAQVVICPEDGGRIGQIAVNGRRYLRGADDAPAGPAYWGSWGSYPLLPWSNRIPNGEFSHAGRAWRVPVSWQDGSALHGLACRVPWRVVSAEPTRLALTIDVCGGDYTVRGDQTFTLTATHLDQTLAVVNRGDESMPVGLGIHPWFAPAPVQVPAGQMWPGEPMPTGPPVAVTGDADLRTARIPPTMDRCYTGLTGTAATVGDLTLSWAGPITQVVVYSGDPPWLCVEPVTMANDGFGLAERGLDGHGVLVAAPGDRFEVGYRFTWAAP